MKELANEFLNSGKGIIPIEKSSKIPLVTRNEIYSATRNIGNFGGNYCSNQWLDSILDLKKEIPLNEFYELCFEKGYASDLLALKLEWTKYLIEEDPSRVHLGRVYKIHSVRDKPPLLRAVERNKFEIVKYLVRKGSKVRSYETRLLQVAAYDVKNVNMLRYLIKKGANAHVLKKEIKSPYHTMDSKIVKLIKRKTAVSGYQPLDCSNIFYSPSYWEKY